MRDTKETGATTSEKRTLGILDLSQLKFRAQRTKLMIRTLAQRQTTTSWVWSQAQRLFCHIPQRSFFKRYFATKQGLVHTVFLVLIGVAVWQGHALSGLDNTSLLYAYVAADEVGAGPLDPSAYAQTDTNTGGGSRLASVEARLYC